MASAQSLNRQNPEEVLQFAVILWMRCTLPTECVYWATPNGGRRGKREAGRFKAGGVLAGIPDIFVLYRGQLLGIELKAPPKRLKSGKLSSSRARPSPEQIALHAKLRMAGAVVEVCRSIEEIERFLRNNGVPMRGTALAR